MSIPDMLDVAARWSPWARPFPPTIQRDVDLPDAMNASLCLVVQGVRRCGKSTLLQQLPAHYGFPADRCAYLNCEDPRLLRCSTWECLDRLVEQFRARHGGREPLAFFLDEVQAIEGWQSWLRARLDDASTDRFFVTGSNATLLSGELASALTGRHLTVELFPFDLAEARRRDPDTSVELHLRHGGFPAAAPNADGDRLLAHYFEDIVVRDIRERVRARSTRPLLQVIQMAFESAGSEISLRRIAAATGIATDTAATYLDAAESAYLLFSCPYFAFSERKRAARNRKYYPVDTALRRVVTTPTGADRGKALECAVHLALRRRFGPISYWREGGEVDFVVHDRGRILPVQVTWDEPQERHERAVRSFYERFPQADEMVVVTAATFEDAVASI